MHSKYAIFSMLSYPLAGIFKEAQESASLTNYYIKKN